MATAYQFPVRIYSQQEAAALHFPAHLNVLLLGEKTAPTPDVYIYDVRLDYRRGRCSVSQQCGWGTPALVLGFRGFNDH
ncbi:MAG: hypothetical protein SGI86_15840 [Deltaproteobacteria bacterium]|nr:hypothetical protein [Deltaproteobacteria bacterium]